MHAAIGHNSGARRSYSASEIDAAIRGKIRSDNIRDDTSLMQRMRWELWLSPLSTRAKLVGLAIWEHADEDGANAFPSIDRLRVMVGGSKRDVTAAINEFSQWEFAKVKKGAGRRANEYQFQIPAKTIEELSSAVVVPLRSHKSSSTTAVPKTNGSTTAVPQDSSSEEVCSTVVVPSPPRSSTIAYIGTRAEDLIDLEERKKDSDPYGSGAAAPPSNDQQAALADQMPPAAGLPLPAGDPVPPANVPAPPPDASAPSQPDLPLLPDDPTPPPPVPDAKEIVWRKGLDWLAQASGQPTGKLRSLIGRWLKEVTPAELVNFMRDAGNARTGDPIGYISRIVEQHARAARNVRRENGRLVVFGDFKTELEQILVGRDLQRALDQIGGRISIGVSGLELEARVRGLAVELVERAADQDRRYAAAVAAKAQDGSAADKYQHLYDGVL